jgi:hypothetical protein
MPKNPWNETGLRFRNRTTMNIVSDLAHHVCALPSDAFVLPVRMAMSGILAAGLAMWGAIACLAGEKAEVRFSDVAESSSIDFRHHSPLSPLRHIHLYMGSGLAWFDYDRDGWPDLFFCQGLSFPPEPKGRRPSDQCYRNRHDGTFEKITAPAGLADDEYSMGAAAADYDNDGFADLYVTNFGENRLYRNNGDGTFAEKGRDLGVSDRGFGSSIAWGDIDGDGNLDLFVVHYLAIDPQNYPTCTVKEGGKVLSVTCQPRDMIPERDVLYRNRGDGSFENFSGPGGLLSAPARQGLGIIAADLDGDGDVDFYVANDTVPNQLWENTGEGRFVDRGAISGTAVNRFGVATASMGLAVGDIDGDGMFDLFVTNYFKETNTLFRNEGGLLFLDVTDEMGLGAPSRLRLGFGTSMVDPDNDGWLDLFVANGHVQDRARELGRSDEPFAQLASFYHNQEGRRFGDVSHSSGDYFRRPHVGRGCAAADFDRDGLIDLAVSHLDDRPALLRNVTRGAGHSLWLELIGTRSNRGGIGAMVSARADGRDLVRVRQAGTSYLSCDEERLLIGIGRARRAERITVRWPGGKAETWRDVPAGRLVRLIEGSGESG